MYVKVLRWDQSHRCEDCGEQSYHRVSLGDKIAWFRLEHSKARQAAWEQQAESAPYPHRLQLRRNARSTFKRFDPVEGQPVDRTGKAHPYSGLSSRPDKLVRLSGNEHTLWVADWRARELKVGPYK